MKTKLITLQVLSAGASVIGLIGALGFSTPAYAISTLKQVQVTNGSQIDLLFDTKISKSQIKTEFFNDVIQISLSDVSVYPAKISSVSGGSITKIFAYQYAPKLVRCRLSVKGKAESYKDRIQLITSDSASGGSSRVLTVRLGASVVGAGERANRNIADSDQIKTQSTRAQVAAREDTALTDAGRDQKEPKINDIDERALLDRVLKSNPSVPSAAVAVTPSAKSEKETPLENPVIRSESHALGGGKALPSPLSALGKLAFVVALFSAMAFAVKKFWKGKAETEVAGAGLMNSLGKFARQIAPQISLKPRSKKMIEVISNHHLGPKKSIAVVRVAGRMLVLGITDEAINLITQISDPDSTDAGESFDEVTEAPELGDIFGTTQPVSAPNAQKAQSGGALSAGPAIFSDLLQAESVKPAMGAAVANGKLARSQVSPASAFSNSSHSLGTSAPKDVRVTNYGMSAGAAPKSNINASAAAGLSGVRAQIRSKLEGLKQI